MPVLKIVSQGRQNHTGILGGVEFKNGVSTYSVSPRDAYRIGAIIKVVDAETGEPLSAILKQLQTRRMSAKQIEESQIADAQAAQSQSTTEPQTQPTAAVVDAPVDAPVDAQAAPAADAPKYTREQIDAIADQGIEALRAFASPLGVKGVSIVKIVDELVKKLGIEG